MGFDSLVGFNFKLDLPDLFVGLVSLALRRVCGLRHDLVLRGGALFLLLADLLEVFHRILLAIFVLIGAEVRYVRCIAQLTHLALGLYLAFPCAHLLVLRSMNRPQRHQTLIRVVPVVDVAELVCLAARPDLHHDRAVPQRQQLVLLQGRDLSEFHFLYNS